jgi:hypothetical protein
MNTPKNAAASQPPATSIALQHLQPETIMSPFILHLSSFIIL